VNVELPDILTAENTVLEHQLAVLSAPHESRRLRVPARITNLIGRGIACVWW